MLTWRLWRELGRAERQHPLFRYLIQSEPQSWSKWFNQLLRILLVFGAVALCSVFAPYVIAIAIGLAFSVLLFFVLGQGLIYGFIWSGHVSAAINNMYANNIYPLLAITPQGPQGVHLIVAKAVLHRHRFNTISGTLSLLLRIALVSFTAVLFFQTVSLLSTENVWARNISGQHLLLLLAVYPLLALIYLDHVQSTLTAMLLGISVAATFQHVSPTVARIITMSAFLLGQLLLYVGLHTIALLCLVSMATALSITDFAPLLGLWLSATLGLHFVVREAILRLLWHRISYQLN